MYEMYGLFCKRQAQDEKRIVPSEMWANSKDAWRYLCRHVSYMVSHELSYKDTEFELGAKPELQQIALKHGLLTDIYAVKQLSR